MLKLFGRYQHVHRMHSLNFPSWSSLLWSMAQSFYERTSGVQWQANPWDRKSPATTVMCTIHTSSHRPTSRPYNFMQLAMAKQLRCVPQPPTLSSWGFWVTLAQWYSASWIFWHATSEDEKSKRPQVINKSLKTCPAVLLHLWAPLILNHTTKAICTVYVYIYIWVCLIDDDG